MTWQTHDRLFANQVGVTWAVRTFARSSLSCALFAGQIKDGKAVWVLTDSGPREFVEQRTTVFEGWLRSMGFMPGGDPTLFEASPDEVREWSRSEGNLVDPDPLRIPSEIELVDRATYTEALHAPGAIVRPCGATTGTVRLRTTILLDAIEPGSVEFVWWRAGRRAEHTGYLRSWLGERLTVPEGFAAALPGAVLDATVVGFEPSEPSDDDTGRLEAVQVVITDILGLDGGRLDHLPEGERTRILGEVPGLDLETHRLGDWLYAAPREVVQPPGRRRTRPGLEVLDPRAPYGAPGSRIALDPALA